MGDIQTMGSYSLSLEQRVDLPPFTEVAQFHTQSLFTEVAREKINESGVRGSVVNSTPCIVWSGRSARKVNALT